MIVVPSGFLTSGLGTPRCRLRPKRKAPTAMTSVPSREVGRGFTNSLLRSAEMAKYCCQIWNVP